MPPSVLNRTAPEFFHPPAIWLSGIVLLLSVPFQLCVLPERTPKRRAHAWVGPHIVTARQADVQRYLAAAAPRVEPRAPVTTSFPPLPPAAQRSTSISA